MPGRKKIALAWSGGKDAALTLHTLLKDERYEVVALLTTFHQSTDRSSMHGHTPDLIRRQAKAMQLPLHEIWIQEKGLSPYEKAMSKGIQTLKEKYAIKGIAFGDLFLEDIRQYREEKMADTGLSCIFPIWQYPTHKAAQTIIDSGIQTRVCCVSSPRLDKEFVDRDYTDAFINEIPKNIDPCGENGEFHTFVFDAPFFEKPVNIQSGTPFFVPVDPQFKIEHKVEGHWYVDLTIQH